MSFCSGTKLAELYMTFSRTLYMFQYNLHMGTMYVQLWTQIITNAGDNYNYAPSAHFVP